MTPFNTNPYNFVPVDATQAVTDDVRGHDGRPPRPGEVLVTGTLKVEIEAITPLLVGHSQFPVRDLANPSLMAFTKAWIRDQEPRPKERQDLLQSAPDKKVLQPMRAVWLQHSPVLIAPESLKGALMGSVQSLTAAPMSRVADEHYSFRPNLAGRPGNTNPRCIAVIEAIRYQPDRPAIEELTLTLAPESEIIFVQSERDLLDLGQIGQLVPAGTPLMIEGLRSRRKHNPQGGDVSPVVLTVDHRIHRYLHGLDGQAILLSQFAKSRGAKDDIHPHPAVLLPDAFTSLGRICLEQGSAWLATFNKGLATVWTQYGQSAGLGQTPPEWRVGDVLYVEVDSLTEPSSLVTMGHHFYYRSGYIDSVSRQWNGLDSNGNVRYQKRQELRPHLHESSADRPRLTAARAIAGFVDDPAAASGERVGDWVKPWGHRMAGRIALNHAVEQGCEVPAEKRFWNAGKTYAYYCPDDQRDEGWTLLPELGGPKASAVEHYLQQPGSGSAAGVSGLWTYGDSLRIPTDGPPEIARRSPGLAGRKVYPHQLSRIEARMDPVCNVDDRSPPEARKRRTELASNPRAQWARWILNAGSILRCTLDVKDLRLWELGAVWAALRPGDWAGWLQQKVVHPDVSSKLPLSLDALKLADVQARNRAESYGNKLGHGRPLGMGSVIYTVSAAELKAVSTSSADVVGADLQSWQHRSFAALWQQLLAGVGDDDRPKDWKAFDRRLAAWLRAHQFSQVERDYPRGKARKIYGHHTGMRIAHANQRRGIEIDQGQIRPLAPLWKDG